MFSFGLFSIIIIVLFIGSVLLSSWWNRDEPF